MKEDDTKKPLKEEKLGLNKFKFFFLFFFISGSIHAQIFINGFSQFENYSAPPGYDKILSEDVNKDGFPDLLLYGDTGNILFYQGNKEKKFSRPKVFRAAYDFYSIVPINKKKNYYAFISRNEKICGVFEFNGKKQIKIIDRFKFNSYPENLSVEDLDRDGNPDLIISGVAFNGISILNFAGNVLFETKIERNKSFPFLSLADLNKDYYKDLLAYDLFGQSAIILINTTYGEFEKVDSLSVSGRVYGMRAVDINRDGYEDLLIAQKNGIRLYSGDRERFFVYDKTLRTKTPASKIVVDDLNWDRYYDIAYLDEKKKELRILFAKSKLDFYPEILLLKRESLNDLISYNVNKIKNIAALSQSGEVINVSRALRMVEGSKFIFTASPGKIVSFDSNKDGINDILLLDRDQNALKIIIRSPTGVPAWLYVFPLMKKHNEISSFNTSSGGEIFCYSIGDREIEKISLDHKNKKTERAFLYTRQPIIDAKTFEIDGENIFGAATISDNNLAFETFSFKEGKSERKELEIMRGPYVSTFSVDDEVSFFSWEEKDSKRKFSEITVRGNEKYLLEKISFEASNADFYSNDLAGDFLKAKNNVSLSFVYNDSNEHIIFTSDTLIAQLAPNNVLKKLDVRNKEQFFFEPENTDGFRNIFVHNREQEEIGRLEIDIENKRIEYSGVAKVENLHSYFVKNLRYREYYLVYTDTVENCVHIKSLMSK